MGKVFVVSQMMTGKTKHISLDFQEVEVHGIEGVKHELKLFFRGNYFDGQLISG